MRRTLRRSLKRFAKPATIWFSAIVYLLLVSGIPVPIPVIETAAVEKDRSQPFPCMDSKCGCRSAEQCWRSCCCHSLKQRVAWARQRGVEPPSFVKAELAKQGEQSVACTAKTSGCCQPEKVAKRCCESEEKRSPQTARSSRGSKTVVLLQALGCRGVDHNWLGVATAIPLNLQPTEFELLASGWLRVVPVLSRPVPSSLPAVPPPQSAIA